MITRSFGPAMLGRVVLRCDGPKCQPRRRFVSRHWRARKARALAAEYGWKSDGRRDHCGTCVGTIYVVTGQPTDILRQVVRLRAELEAS
jgi:hypothetical protein